MSDSGLGLELPGAGVAPPLPLAAPAPLVGIRDACADDVPGLAAGVVELPLLRRYGVTEPGLRRDLDGALARGDGLVTATRDGEPVGFAWYLEHGTFATGGYLRLIALRPGQQGLRLGARLLDEVERRVAARSRTLFLLVSDFNLDAQRFYERRGYQPGGRLQALVRPDIDELIYWKQLR